MHEKKKLLLSSFPIETRQNTHISEKKNKMIHPFHTTHTSFCLYNEFLFQFILFFFFWECDLLLSNKIKLLHHNSEHNSLLNILFQMVVWKSKSDDSWMSKMCISFVCVWCFCQFFLIFHFSFVFLLLFIFWSRLIEYLCHKTNSHIRDHHIIRCSYFHKWFKYTNLSFEAILMINTVFDFEIPLLTMTKLLGKIFSKPWTALMV